MEQEKWPVVRSVSISIQRGVTSATLLSLTYWVYSFRCFFSIHISSYAANSLVYEETVCLKIMIWLQVVRGLLCSVLRLLVTWLLSLKKGTNHSGRMWERSISFGSAVLSRRWRRVQFWKPHFKKDRGNIYIYIYMVTKRGSEGEVRLRKHRPRGESCFRPEKQRGGNTALGVVCALNVSRMQRGSVGVCVPWDRPKNNPLC